MTDASLPDSVQSLCDLMTGMATALIDHPDKLRLEVEQFDTETVVRLFVPSDDLGKLIGKQGRTARSLRTILGAAASKAQQRLSLDIQSE